MFSRRLNNLAESRAETAYASPRQRGAHETSSAPPAAGHLLLDLQRVFGNRHVQHIVERARQAADGMPVIQPRLVVGPADDRYEREADRMAEQVVGHVVPSPTALEAEVAQHHELIGAEGGTVPRDVQRTINGARAGQHLPDPVRRTMEQALGADFGNVRLHTDARADTLNRALGSNAFTTGRDVFFRRGAYAPNSRDGQSLLTHELTHVVQQGAGLGRAAPPHGTLQCKMKFSADRLEKDGKLLTAPEGQGINRLFKKISDNLKKYAKIADHDTSRQLTRLQNLEALASDWIGTYAASKDLDVVQMTLLVKAMIPEVRTEIEALADERAEQYLERTVATSWKTLPDDDESRRQDVRFREPRSGAHFRYITTTGAKAMSLFSQEHRQAMAAVKDRRLTDDELAAIRVFTAGDYRYMNPTQAGDEARLTGTIEYLSKADQNETTWALKATQALTKSGKLDASDRRQVKIEAMQHVRQASSGLDKLPEFHGNLYRGMTMTPDALRQDYLQDNVVIWPSLTSASTSRYVATQYVLYPTSPKVGVILILTNATGKDVRKISMNTVEEEVLLLPGSRLKVTKPPVELSDTRWEVELRQEDAGQLPPANASTSIASTSSTAATGPLSNSTMTSSTATTTLAPVNAPTSTATTTTSVTTGASAPAKPLTRSQRAPGVAEDNVFQLTQPLTQGAWSSGLSKVRVLSVKDDRTQVLVLVLGSGRPTFWVGRTVLELAIGQRLPLDG